MRAVIRPFLAIAAGWIVWAASWLAFTAGAAWLFPEALAEGQPIVSPVFLWLFIATSALLSVIAGFVTGTIAREARVAAVWVFAIVQQGFGVVAEMSYWALMPVWYHLVFLSLVIPMTVLGGWLAGTRQAHGGRVLATAS